MNVRINLELYNVYNSASRRKTYHKSAMLYSRWDGSPENGAVLDARIEAVRNRLKESKRSYWNALSLARELVSDAEADNKSGNIRFYPTLQDSPLVTFVWRVFLDAAHESYELTCHKVQYDERRLLAKMDSVDWQKKAK